MLKGLRVAFHTLGCKVNIYESEVMEEQLREAGAEVVPFDAPADVYVINTCTVTNIADRKSRQMLHRAKKQNSSAVLVATGCYTELADVDTLRQEGVDLVLGNNEKGSIAAALEAYLEKGLTPVRTPIGEVRGIERLSLSKPHAHNRADVKVQDGCNQFCSYCAIPLARGRIRSKRIEDTVREVTEIAKNGIREVVLTGIHLSSYGKDLSGEADLLKLIHAVNEIPGIRRIRLGSLEPRIVTAPFVEGLLAAEKLCPHFHLSLQSGCSETLRRMNRHYTPEEYLEGVRLLREAYGNPAITTDIIAGFPGETDEAFETSYRFAKEAGFYEMHVFKFSRRRGTAADRMPDQVPEEVKTLRSNRLLALSKEMSEAYRREALGTREEVLTEEEVTIDGRAYLTGYTRTYIRTLVPVSCGVNTVVSGTLSALFNEDTMILSPDPETP